MIDTFLASWELFGATYLAAWSAAAVLGIAGIPVVARDRIFLGAAVTQAAMLGIGLALWLRYLPAAAELPWLESPRLVPCLAVGLAVVTTLVTMRAGDYGAGGEGLVGWVFLGAGSLSIVLLAHAPVGQREIDQRLASSVIGAAPADAWAMAGLALGLILLVASCRRPLTLVIADPAMARALGLRLGWWETGLALGLGVVLGLTLNLVGMLYTFGCLVLPSLAAKHLCRRIASLFVVAPALAVATAVAGFMAGNHHDLPQAPLTVLLLAALLPVAWLIRR